MVDILTVLVAIIICGLVKRKLADLRFLYDLRK